MAFDQLRDLTQGIRIADVLDVLVVWGFVYATISWFRRAGSRFVLLGLGALVLLYFISSLLEMYLTLLIFQAGITVALVALVVIFQEDLRRAFERIATSTPLARPRTSAKSADAVDMIVEAAATLANKRLGALIVLRAKEPLERHLSGGIVLDGRLSEPLLYSIFDESSPGHDGAVVIDGRRVTKFGAHLPLASHTDAIARYGTRHSAAVGLSERSDALVIAVSEERGTISVAQAGRLEQLSPPELQRRLESFTRALTPDPESTVKQLFARRLGSKAISFAIALTAWVLVSGYQSQLVTRTFDVPIEFIDVPDGWTLEEAIPHEARVTLSGSNRAFQLLDPSSLRLTVQAGELRSGEQLLTLTEDDVQHPADLEVRRIEPRNVQLRAYPTTVVEAAVNPLVTGEPGPGRVLLGLTAQPSRVKLIVPRNERAKYGSVRTSPVDVSAIQRSTTVQREIVVPRGAQLAKGEPAEVDIRVEIAEPEPAPALSP